MCWTTPASSLLLVNPRHVHNLPGRKTDACDAAWLAQLLECGLLHGSFIPPKEIAVLRDLTRYRKKIVQERIRETQRLQKLFGRRRDKARLGGNRYHGRVEPGDDRGAHSRRERR